MSQVEYEHLMINNTHISDAFVYFSFVIKNARKLSKLYNEIAHHDFPFRSKFFLFNDSVLVIAERGKHHDWKKSGKRFLSKWKVKYQEPLAIFIYNDNNKMITCVMDLKRLVRSKI